MAEHVSEERCAVMSIVFCFVFHLSSEAAGHSVEKDKLQSTRMASATDIEYPFVLDAGEWV